METIITISSGSEEDESDVEIIYGYSNGNSYSNSNVIATADRLPQTTNLDVSPVYHDSKHPKRTQKVGLSKKHSLMALPAADLRKGDVTNVTKQEREKLQESPTNHPSSKKTGFHVGNCSTDQTIPSSKQGCGNRYIDLKIQAKKQSIKAHDSDYTPFVKLRRLPVLENSTQISLLLTDLNKNSAPHYLGTSNLQNMAKSGDEPLPEAPAGLQQQEERNDSDSEQKTAASLFEDKYATIVKEHSTREERRDDVLVPYDLSPESLAEQVQGDRSSSSKSHESLVSRNSEDQADPALASYEAQAESASAWKLKEEEASNASDPVRWDPPGDPQIVCKIEDMDQVSGTPPWDQEIESPSDFLWQDESDEEILEKDENCETPAELCSRSLSLVYSTIDENYPEGTLQLLSDLLHPSYYPPKDIISHLVHGILLDPHCPHHLCVHAFNLLMKTQRLHMADKNTVPWSWEMLRSVMANQLDQDHSKRHRCEVVHMLLEYIVQTLEDDFQYKCSKSAPHQSIAKATLSYDQHYPQVRDVIRWLFFAIMKSVEYGESGEAARERDEANRMVSILQRMLSLALEADLSPTLTSAKLSQELFHMLLGDMPLRAHRMLLLESLQSMQLRCKLLEHLLDYACPLKNPVPMSLGLLLHFLKYCTLTPDPTDGAERWQKWEELIHLLWMLLLSYNKAMKGHLCSSVLEQKLCSGTLVYRQYDKVTQPEVREAVEAFLTRSQEDLGQTLPFHVEESLTYLQDYLLDVCQC
ncbi:uncharacterized protein simc1 isoform 2-T2 [Aulostomus maculatus]